jgi:hypothetical protein
MKKVIQKALCALLSLSVAVGAAQLGSVPASAAANDFIVVNGVLIDYNGSGASVRIPDTVKSIGDYAFNECYDLQNVIIPASVTSIGRYAFSKCESIEKLTIPDSVTSIGNYAFNECTGLENITISNNVKSIGISSFYDCSSLSKVTLPSALVSIGKNAFEGCTDLSSVTFQSSAGTFGADIFSDCGKLTISGYANSAIQTYANKNKISFKSIGLGKFTLDSKNYVLPPNGTYTIGTKLIGAGLTVKSSLSKNKIIKIVNNGGGEYKITGLKSGTVNITFTVYDKNKKQVGRATVKVTVQRGSSARGDGKKQEVKLS